MLHQAVPVPVSVVVPVSLVVPIQALVLDLNLVVLSFLLVGVLVSVLVPASMVPVPVQVRGQ
jgi:hypothetical protein